MTIAHYPQLLNQFVAPHHYNLYKLPKHVGENHLGVLLSTIFYYISLSTQSIQSQATFHAPTLEDIPLHKT